MDGDASMSQEFMPAFYNMKDDEGLDDCHNVLWAKVSSHIIGLECPTFFYSTTKIHISYPHELPEDPLGVLKTILMEL